MKRFSIRSRITLFYSVLLLLCLVFIGIFFYFTADSQLYSVTRNSLEQAVKHASSQLTYYENQVELSPDFDFYSGQVTILLYGPKGTSLAGSAPSGFPAGTPLTTDQCREVEGSQETFLVYDLLVTHPQASSIWIRGIYQMNDSLTFFQAVRRTSVFVLPLMFFLAVFGGGMLTKRAFAPVENMCRAAGEISEGNDLSRRIVIKGPENELSRLAQAWNHMMERLQKAFENERRFSSDVSHELKTPIAVILSSCEYALEKPRSREEYEKILVDIEKQAKRMSALSSQLLELSQNMNAPGALQKEEIDLSFLCESICEEMEKQAAEKKISIQRKIQPEVIAWADEMQMIRLLVNLLTNAVRYGKEGGWIRAALWKENGNVHLTVEDNGEGISEEELPFLFERFHRAQNGEGKKEGFGLGLSYVRWIAEAHGGTVKAESKLGEGSLFTVVIPEGKRE